MTIRGAQAVKQGQDIKNQSGNAIWFILLAIVLLVALTLTITHFSNTAQQTGSTDLERIQASSILRYSKTLEQTIEQMQNHDISVNSLSFDTPEITGYANAACTTDDCKLFKTAGGGQTYQPPDTAWLDQNQSAQAFYGQWIFTGKICVQGVGNYSETIGVSCSAAASNSDLVMLLPYVSLGVCLTLNTMAGVANPSGAPPVGTSDAWAASPQFTGTFATGANIGLNDASLFRQQSGCFQGAGTPPGGTYVFYHVLVAQ
jgi:hypothetical protein